MRKNPSRGNSYGLGDALILGGALVCMATYMGEKYFSAPVIDEINITAQSADATESIDDKVLKREFDEAPVINHKLESMSIAKADDLGIYSTEATQYQDLLNNQK